MKKRFTRIIAALALLVFMAPSMVAVGQTTVTQTTFTAISGNVNNDTKVSYAAYKGGGTSNPAANSGAIRLYQNSNGQTGGYVVIGVTSGYQITSATIQSTMATTTGYKLTDTDPGNTTPAKNTFNVSNYSLSANTDYTVSNISTQYIIFACFGTSTSSRLYLSKISVTYESTGGQTTTYTVTYDCNGGTSGCPENVTDITAGTSINLAAAPTKTDYTFNGWSDGSTTYNAGAAYTVNGDVTMTAQWQLDVDYLFYESFNTNNGTGGNDNQWSGSIATSTLNSDNDDWTFANGSGAYQCAKFGASSKLGSAQTPAISHTGDATLTFKAAAWNGSSESTTLKLSATSGTLSASTVTLVKGSWTDYTISITGITTSTQIKFEGNAASNSRFFLDEVMVVEVAPSTDPSITAANVDIAYNATSGSIAYTIENEPNPAGTLTANTTASWLTLGTVTATTVPFTCTANDNVVSRTATVTLTYSFGIESTTKDITVTQGVDATLGTASNPYTVAQARTFIDGLGGSTSTEKYVSGIVSQVDSYNSQYNSITYWISDDGTTTNQLEVYSGKGIDGADFSSVNDVEVTAEVVVKGNLKKYNSTYEFDKNNELVVYNGPQHNVEAPTFSPVAGTYTSAQTVTLSCTTTGTTIYYTTDGTDPTNASTQYTTPLSVSTATTIKAVAYDGTNYSNVSTAIYHINSETSPYTVAQVMAMPAYQLPANGIYVSGIVSQDGSSLSSGALNYYISTDGTTGTELYVFKGKNLDNTNFSATTDILAGDIVTVYGNVIDYTSSGTTTREFSSGNYLVAYQRPTTNHTLTIANPANVTITAVYGTDGVLTNGENDAILSGTQITVTVNVAAGYVLDALTVTGDNNQTVTVTETSTPGVYTFDMPAHNATVSATASVAPVVTTSTYTLATSITSGKQYIIVGKADSKYYAMGYDKGSNRHAIEITSDGAIATATIANSQTNAHEFTISSLGGGYYSIMDATTSGGYLYAASSSGNQLKTETTLDENHNGDWKITINAETGVASVVADQSSNRNVMQFNTSGLFNCYSSASQHPVYLYEKVEPQTYTLPITAADFTSNPATGYYFIASPVSENITPSADNGITSGNYDLYFWDEPAHTWRNYKQNSAGTNTNAGFSIENGKGYLYANQAGTTIQFTGTPLTETSKAITLSKQNTTTAHGAWNLIGNPFTEAAYLYDANGRNRAYYIMKNDGSDVISATLGTAVAKMNGIFVVADAHNEVVTFSTTAPSGGSKFLALNINQNRGDVIDRAIVNFNEGSELPKLQLFESTKLYIPQDEGDYAVVNGNNQGTLPINFKATANGTYTLNIDTENVTFSTLILHDNLTGEDINLLAKATYSFEATTSDEETRFTLTYSKDGEGVALPYSYGFETTLAEEGWTAITNISNSGVSTGEESHSGTHFFRFNYNENPAAYLVTPLLTGTENGVAVSFYYRSYMESWPDSFKVGYSTDETVTDPSEFTYGPLIEDAPEEWTLYEGFLPAGTKYMAIQYVYSDGYYLYLDDFSFVEPDACPKPGSLNVANVTDNAATLTWTGNSDSYSVKLGCATNITSMGNYNFEDETIDAAFDNDTEYPWVIWNENPNDGSYCIASGNYGEHSTTSSISMTVNFEKTGIIEFFSRAESESISYDYGFFSIDGELQFMEGGETSFNWKKHRFEVEPGTHVFTWSYLKDYSMSGHADRFFIDDIQIKSADYTWNTYTTTNTTYAFEGLTPDTDYKVLVQGICGDETSVDSEPFAFTTDMAIPTFEKTITAYTDNSGYYLIASPVGNDLGLTPATEVTNLVDGSFDLYMFDQTGDDDGKQWLNYKANAFSTLEMGLGYLYANSETVILTFTGTPIDTDEDFMIEVIYDAGSDFPGLNLLGNPFAEDAYLVNNEGIGLAYHRLDPTTNTYITVDDDSAIEAMEGIFYEANAAGQVFFSTTVPTTSKSNLNITVSQGRGMIDNAIVRFGEGNTLRKISLRDNSTKVYIPQNGNEYALVNANEFGEMPVNFKAESNGTYTMSFSNQNIEFSYLHLIDNLTGADVDLLANPSYSFDAKTSDYASRFKLVFTAGNTSSDSDFAYVSNGNVIVNGEGTLQVIDMMGRVISTEQINGVSSIKLNAAAGVYVLQLNDKTQKIVVK